MKTTVRERRINNELKEQSLLSPAAGVADMTNDGFNVMLRDEPLICFTVKIPDNYPFGIPVAASNDYHLSPIDGNFWKPQYRLRQFVDWLATDIRAAREHFGKDPEAKILMGKIWCVGQK